MSSNYFTKTFQQNIYDNTNKNYTATAWSAETTSILNEGSIMHYLNTIRASRSD